MFTKLMFKFLILIYLFSVSSYSQPYEQQEIGQQEVEQQEIEYEDDLSEEVADGSGESNKTGVTVGSCGRTNFDDKEKIIGGREAVLGQFPWQASLYMSHTNGRQETCGGCLLNDQWILTAAHCITDESNGNYLVYALQATVGLLNKQRRDPRWQIRLADCAIKHERWRGGEGGFANDLALIRVPYNNRFNITFPSGGIVNGICLPPATNPPYEPTGTARIAGWGVTQDGVPSNVLKYTDIGIISNQRCSALSNSFPFQIISSMICQGIDRTSPCFGDSGGCLIQRIKNENRYTQIGIVSTGPQDCGNDRDPNGIYTKVSYFTKWIEDNIRANDKNAKCRGRVLQLQ